MTSKEWQKLHPIRWKRLQRKYRLKHRKPLFCKECGKTLTARRRGKQLCSKQCQKVRSLANSKRCRDKSYQLFSTYKLSLGCKKCGYKKCAGCLDFHHINPQEKEFRIIATHWKSQSPLFLNELKKCVLLCKNCHYEEHFNGGLGYGRKTKEKENGKI